MGDITTWIAQARQGDRAALDQLVASVYPELRRIAHARLAPHAHNALLNTTTLVHECYMKFVGAQRLNVEDRGHFLAYAASAMRSIIVDQARASLTQRRGGHAAHVTLDTANSGEVAQAEDQIFDVDSAITELARLSPRLAQVVEMRYFGGMNDEEIGLALGVNGRTVRRDWEKARMMLVAALRD
jgi:RNA polymerase sigma factor (TIGR02999 family)